MPSRVIREGLLDSERYWSASIEARQLFIHLMLIADDFGLVSLAPVLIRRRCFDDAPTPAKIDKMIEQLADADLIRLYTVGADSSPARYAFIPKFGQRLRLMRCKHPIPPEALFKDDAEAAEKFKVNKAKFESLSAGRGQMTGIRRPEVEGKGREVESKTGKGEQLGVEQWAERQGIKRLHGEDQIAYRKRISDAYVKSIAPAGTA